MRLRPETTGTRTTWRMPAWMPLLWLLVAPAAAQPNTVPFRTLSLDEGLSQSSVYAVWQDRAGFLWFGTQDGLNRYDGYRFVVYGPDGPDALAAGWIGALAEDGDGRLWIGTHGGGLDARDPHTGAVTHHRHDPADPGSLAHDIVSALLVDRAGVLWVGTYGGLSRLAPATGRFTSYRHDPADSTSLPAERALVLAEDAAGALWVGTDGGGLARFDADRFTRVLPGVILALHAGASGALWAGTAAGGLVRLAPATGRVTRYRHDPADPGSLSADRVLSVREDAAGRVWVGTSRGLNRLDPATGRITRFFHDPADPESLSNDLVTALFEDASGTLWVGTDGGGLNRRGRFDHFKNRPAVPGSLNHNLIRALFEDASGTLWVGTDGGGLSRFDAAAGRFTAYRAGPDGLCHDRVFGLTEDAAGRFWVATGGGLCRLDRATGRFTAYRHDPADPGTLSSDRTLFVYENPARPGDLWVGTWGGGLNRMDAATGRFTAYRHDPADPASLSNNRIIAARAGRDGSLWVGTFGGGLNRLDPATGRATRYRHDPADPGSLANDIVAALHEDAAGRLWIGTGGGLDRLDPGAEFFVHYTRRDGLPDDTIYGILEDTAGHLWMSTNRGLAVLDSTGGVQATFDAADGLQSNEFGQGAYARGHDGTLYFGGINGFNRFRPGDVLVRRPPPVVLTGFTTARRDSALAGPATGFRLRPEDRFFTFTFAALDYANPARNRYAFRLDGLDADWTYRTADRRTATYPNLPGGTYTFRVRGAGPTGVWNEAGLAVTVTVVPPFWATWWFRLAAGLGVLGGLGSVAYGWHRVRLRRLEQQRDEQAEIQRRLTESREAERLFLAQELHDGAMQDLYGVQFQLGAAVPDPETRARTQEAVQAVIGKLRGICGELRPPVLAPFGLERAVRAHVERFQEEHPDLAVTTDLVPDGQALPQPMRLALYRVYQEAMNNVVKHAGARHVTVRLTLDAGTVGLEVRDDGKGFTVPARWLDLGRREHYGLLGLAERAAALGGRLDVVSAPGQGTTVRVTAPLPPEA